MTVKQDFTPRPGPLDRTSVAPRLLPHAEDLLFVTGLGGSSRDVGVLPGVGDNQFALGGTMGAALSVGLGLAIARPEREVVVVTGDGELLMNVGALATIGVLAPSNLAIVCMDNGRYGETGNQTSHTSRGVSLEGIARACGITRTATVETESDLDAAARLLGEPGATRLVVAEVSDVITPNPPRDRDGARLRARFRHALLG